MKYILFTFCVLAFCTNCAKEPNTIALELQSYFDSFEAEAEKYNYQIDLSTLDLDAYISNIEIRGTLGQCKSYSDGSKKVVIDAPYWDSATELEREYLVFHELGHCALNRDHNDGQDGEGNCLSIMQSGDNACTSSYNYSNRERLLAELFK